MKVKYKEVEDLTGQKFGRWTVTGYAGFSGRHFWNVRCDCGISREVGAYQLKNGLSKSCGCLVKEINRNKHLIHGETGQKKRSPEFRAFNLAKNQCENPQHENFAKFGGSGIKFLFADFREFLQAAGRKPGREYVLSRIDRQGHYEKGNIEWTRNKNRIRRM